jgi:hypothetical protein
MLPISFFSYPAEQVKDFKGGDQLAVGCDLYGTKFDGDQGTRHGVVVVADAVFFGTTAGGTSCALK